MVKRIIFDIDGTLITGVDFYPAIYNSLKKIGIYDIEKTHIFLQNVKEYENYYNSYEKEKYLNFFSEKLNLKLNDIFLEIFFEELKNIIPNNSNEIKKMLSELTDFELVLLSNYFEESQRNRLTAMGINDYFNEYYGDKITKPNILSYKLAAGIYSPSECLIIGNDKKLDIDIPKSLGFNTIYVNKNGDVDSVVKISSNLIKKIG